MSIKVGGTKSATKKLILTKDFKEGILVIKEQN